MLRGDEKVLGRYDARFEGYDVDAAGEVPGCDPSDTGITGAYVGAFHDYIVKELKYMSQETYYFRGPGLTEGAWNFKHRASGSRGQAGEQTAPDVAVDLSDAMRKNPQLKVCFRPTATSIWQRRFLRPSMTCTTWCCRGRWWRIFRLDTIGGAQGVPACGGAEADEGRFYAGALRR